MEAEASFADLKSFYGESEPSLASFYKHNTIEGNEDVAAEFLSGKDISRIYCHSVGGIRLSDEQLKRQVMTQSFEDVLEGNICSKLCRFNCGQVKLSCFLSLLIDSLPFIATLSTDPKRRYDIKSTSFVLGSSRSACPDIKRKKVQIGAAL